MMNRIICSAYLLLNLFSQFAWAQTIVSADLLEQVQQYSEAKQYDSVILAAEVALSEYSELGRRAQVYYLSGRAYRLLDQLGEATNYLTNAIRNAQDSSLKAKAYYELGKTYSERVQPESAIYHYEQALLYSPDTLVLVLIYEGIADEYNYYFANYKEAEDFYEKALRYQQMFSENNQKTLLRLLYNLAAVHQQRGDFYVALDYAQQAIQIARETQSINLELCFALLGTIYHELVQYSAAITAYENAIGQGIKSGGNTNPDLIRYYNNLGLFYFDQQQYEQAISYYERAQSIASQSLSTQAIADQADSYQHLGNVYTRLHNFTAAHQYLTRALQLKSDFYGDTHPEVARAIEGFSRYYQEQNQLDSALFYQQQALIAEIPDFSAEEVSINPTWEQLQDYSSSYETLNNKAELLYQCYQQSMQPSDLTLAIATFARADSLMHLHRVSYEYESSQLQLLEDQKYSYEMAIASCYLMYEATQDEAYARQALYFMERSKAVILWDVLRNVAARSSLGVSDSLQREERAIKTQLTRVVSEMTEERRSPSPNRTKLDSLQEKRFSLHRRQTRLQETLAAAYPSYVQVKYASPALPWSKVEQQLASQRQMIVEFFWGMDYAYALSLSQDNTSFYRIPITDRLVSRIEHLQHLLQKGPSSQQYIQETQAYLTHAYHIYQSFLAPAFAKHLSLPAQITLIPDGPLSYLPVEALLTEEVTLTDDPDFRVLPYLLRSSTVQYSPSLQVLLNPLRSASASNAYLRLLAFGFTDRLSSIASTQPAELVALPGTFKEIKAIERLTSAQLLAGPQASETHFKHHAEDYQILHLALHGLADSTNSSNNVLFFPASSDSINDGELHSFELYDLQLTNTKLAVLSACETGTGRWEAGEGVYSMGRGFAYAGCPSVIMSLWKVNDAFTARIMPSLYRSLLKGSRVDEALQKAKIQFIDGANKYQAHPSYWAAFVLQGEFSPIVHYRNTYLAGLLIILISIAYLTIGLARKKRPAI
ncbi:MAG: CHAT domain-containing protein [Bacteroidota bacterium]